MRFVAANGRRRTAAINSPSNFFFQEMDQGRVKKVRGPRSAPQDYSQKFQAAFEKHQRLRAEGKHVRGFGRGGSFRGRGRGGKRGGFRGGKTGGGNFGGRAGI